MFKTTVHIEEMGISAHSQPIIFCTNRKTLKFPKSVSEDWGGGGGGEIQTIAGSRLAYF